VVAPGRPGWWLVGAMIAAGVLAGESALAGERFHFGVKDLSLASAGYSVSHDRREVEQVKGIQLLPHFGYVLWPYFEVLAEPTLVSFRSDSASSAAGGLSLLGRLVIETGTRVVPYLEAGVGILGGKLDFRQTDCNPNFILAGGTGVLIFVTESTAVNVAYRLQHVSNADRCSDNLGINSSLFTIGISHFFE
jgi:opacity protein-like surface antigen